MQMDSYFIKGFDHSICEDYTYIDPNNQFMIISDGCSTSKNSDVASRVLVHACKTQFMNFQKSNSIDILTTPNGYNLLGESVLSHSKFVASLLGFNEFFATLGISFIHKDKIYVYFYGDGFVALNYVNSDIIDSYEIKFTKNEPNYLWRKVNPVKFSMSDSNFLDINGVKCDPTSGIRFEFDLNSINFIGIFTDGVSSITTNNPINDKFGKSINGFSAIEQIMGFKTFGGEFLKRRLNRFSKEFIASGFCNYDDIGCAVMLVEDVDRTKDNL